MPIVRIKQGCTYRRRGMVGAGEVIEVTEAEVRSFGDKFVVLPEPEPVPPPPPPKPKRNPRYKKTRAHKLFDELYALRVEEVKTDRPAPDVHVTVTERQPGEPFMSDVDATPAARRVAQQHSINLALIRGTGKDGRVLVRDVREALHGDAE